MNGDALSKLPASQVREMREGFQILDRDNDGLVNRDDVVDMLTNLGNMTSSSFDKFFTLSRRYGQARLIRGNRSRRIRDRDVAVLPARGAANAASADVPLDAVGSARAAVVADGAGQCVCRV